VPTNLELLAHRRDSLRRRLRLGLIGALISLSMTAMMPRDAGAAADAITDLGTLAGGFSSLPGGMNAGGQVVGGADTATGASVGFLWDETSGMQELPTLGGTTFANGINAGGTIVGRSEVVRFRSHAFRLRPGLPIEDLGTLPGGSISSAYAINAFDQVVGESNTSSGFSFHAFLWDSAGGLQDLGLLSGGRYSVAWSINDGGQVAGEADGADGHPRAFLWTPGPGGGMRDLGTLPGGTFSTARGINNFGQVVGWGDVTGGATHGFLWDPVGGLRDLGTLPGGTGSFAHGLNDAGQVVGGATLADGRTMRAFLWEDPARPMRDLGTLAGGSFSTALGINAAGQIVGHSDNVDGEDRAVRWQINRAPVAADLSITTSQDTAATVTVSASDPDGDVITWSLVAGPAHGSLSGSLPAVTYTPAPGYAGSDSFTFRVNDGAGDSNTATVAITVTAIAPPPPPPPPADDPAGRLKGDGHVDADGKRHRFQFLVREAEGGADRYGKLQYAVWTRGPRADENAEQAARSGRPVSRFVSTSVTGATFSDDPGSAPSRRRGPTVDSVAFVGTGTWNGQPGYTFEATAIDAGEPGPGKDSFAITITSPSGDVVARVSGLLSGGNIQSRRVKTGSER
jgi:probable HAF family extracellular repeat protein